MELLRGRIAFAANFGSDTPALLLKAAKRFGPLNLDRARETYLAAWSAASLAGHLAGADDLLEVSRAARALPSPGDPPRLIGLLLDGLARLVADGPAAAPTLRQAVHALAAGDLSRNEGLRWGWIAATVLWDAAAGRAIIARQVQFARDVGALEQMPADLIALANPKIGAQLFLSARTVEWHLRKIFTKLGISCRRELPVTLVQAA